MAVSMVLQCPFQHTYGQSSPLRQHPIAKYLHGMFFLFTCFSGLGLNSNPCIMVGVQLQRIEERKESISAFYPSRQLLLLFVIRIRFPQTLHSN